MGSYLIYYQKGKSDGLAGKQPDVRGLSEEEKEAYYEGFWVGFDIRKRWEIEEHEERERIRNSGPGKGWVNWSPK